MILRKIIKIVATRCQILRLKCTKFDFGCGSAPDPAGGAYSAPPDPLAGFKGPTSKGREGRREGEGKGRGKGGKREGEGKGEEKGRGPLQSTPPVKKSWIRTCRLCCTKDDDRVRGECMSLSIARCMFRTLSEL